MKILVDTGPLVSAVDKSDPAHQMAMTAMVRLRRRAVLPLTVLVEADHLIRGRVSPSAARAFLKSIAEGTHEVAYPTAGLIRRATEFDNQYADLNLGFVDTCVMAIAERHELPILTFDFADFRATESINGPWSLVLDEHAYLKAIRLTRKR